MLVGQPIVMMGVVAADAEICILGLAVLPRSVVLAELTDYLFLQFPIPRCFYFEMHNKFRQTFGLWFVDDVVLLELLGC